MRLAPPRQPKPPTRPLTRAEFKAEVEAWARKLGVRPKVVHIRQMRRKWGSCSSRGRLTFDVGLLDQLPEFRKRVIVEELLHLRVPAHNRLFKALLKAYLRA